MVSAGFTVLAFDRPSALLESVIPEADACLVVDVHLPEMTGFELCEAVAASGRLLPTIMITGQVDEATRELAQRACPVAILFKPFSRESLLAALSKVFTAAT
jgi:two-component system response regulator FixJ